MPISKSLLIYVADERQVLAEHNCAGFTVQLPYWLTYDFPPQVREKLKAQWGSDWKGQAQKWYKLHDYYMF